jgi:hypothetical protein
MNPDRCVRPISYIAPLMGIFIIYDLHNPEPEFVQWKWPAEQLLMLRANDSASGIQVVSLSAISKSSSIEPLQENRQLLAPGILGSASRQCCSKGSCLSWSPVKINVGTAICPTTAEISSYADDVGQANFACEEQAVKLSSFSRGFCYPA